MSSNVSCESTSTPLYLDKNFYQEFSKTTLRNSDSVSPSSANWILHSSVITCRQPLHTPDFSLHYKFTHVVEHHRNAIGGDGKTVLRTPKNCKWKGAVSGYRIGRGNSDKDAMATPNGMEWKK